MIDSLCSKCGAQIRFDTRTFGLNEVTLEISPCECTKPCDNNSCEFLAETKKQLAEVATKYQNLLSSIESLIGKVSDNG